MAFPLAERMPEPLCPQGSQISQWQRGEAAIPRGRHTHLCAEMPAALRRSADPGDSGWAGALSHRDSRSQPTSLPDYLRPLLFLAQRLPADEKRPRRALSPPQLAGYCTGCRLTRSCSPSITLSSSLYHWLKYSPPQLIGNEALTDVDFYQSAEYNAQP